MDFGTTSLYPFEMWDNDSVYPNIKTGYKYKPHMSDVTVNYFDSQTLNQEGNESAV